MLKLLYITYTETIGNIGDLFVLDSLGIYQKINDKEQNHELVNKRKGYCVPLWDERTDGHTLILCNVKLGWIDANHFLFRSFFRHKNIGIGNTTQRKDSSVVKGYLMTIRDAFSALQTLDPFLSKTGGGKWRVWRHHEFSAPTKEFMH